jgi:hypothetical protein
MELWNVAFRYGPVDVTSPLRSTVCPSSLVRSNNSLCLLFVDSSFFVLSPQPIRMADATYERAIACWRRAGHVAIRSINDYEIAVFPLKFVATGGDNSWRYVLSVVEQLVETVPEHPGMIFTNGATPEAVDLDGPPHEGVFLYKQLSAFLRPVACPFLPRLLHTDAGLQMLIRIPTSPAAPSISPDSRNRV